MSEQIYSELEVQLGLSRKGIDATFNITEESNEWNLVVRSGSLESKTFKVMMLWTKEKGGDYTVKPLTFHIPKQSTSQIPSQESMTSEDYSLDRSMKSKLGQLVPCLQDASGTMIDGFHRIKAKPDAWTVRLEHIKTPVDRALARMTVNFCRRHYTSEEMQNDIGLLIGANYTVQQIVEITGISERTVYRYIPETAKDKIKSEAISQGKVESQVQKVTAVTSPLKTQDTIQMGTEVWRAELVECQNCHMSFHKSRAVIKEGKMYCPNCAPQITPVPLKEEKPKPAFKEKWEQRAAVMHPQKSKFELEVVQELQVEGIPLETDQEFCTAKTIPDAIHRGKKIAFYIDLEELHPEDNEKDERSRSRLKPDYDFTVFPLPYKAKTKEEKERVKAEIREALKW